MDCDFCGDPGAVVRRTGGVPVCDGCWCDVHQVYLFASPGGSMECPGCAWEQGRGFAIYNSDGEDWSWPEFAVEFGLPTGQRAHSTEDGEQP